MSEYKWCHGPKCHKSHTQDRIRGVKGSKVLRTKKVKTTEWNRDNGWQYFCSQGCWNDFFRKYAPQCIAIAPRHEPLETPIEEPKKDSEGYYNRWVITERGVDTSMEQDYKGYRKDIYMTQTKTNTQTFERKNRFTGESVQLTLEETIKHDQIFENEMLATLEDKTLDGPGCSKHWDIVRKNLNWFRKNNAEAYMILLD